MFYMVNDRGEVMIGTGMVTMMTEEGFTDVTESIGVF